MPPTKQKVRTSRHNTGKSKISLLNRCIDKFNSKKCNMFTSPRNLTSRRKKSQVNNSKCMRRRKRRRKIKLDQYIAFYNEMCLSKCIPLIVI